MRRNEQENCREAKVGAVIVKRIDVSLTNFLVSYTNMRNQCLTSPLLLLRFCITYFNPHFCVSKMPTVSMGPVEYAIHFPINTSESLA